MDRRTERWAREKQFFDRIANQLERSISPFEPAVVLRYTAPEPRRRYDKEFRLRLLGDLRGRRVLDAGCGEGSNAVLLALRGAQVTGVDLSERSVALARRRAALNGVSDRTEFLCSPLETAPLPERTFDVLWGDGVLHHVIDELDTLLPKLLRAVKPGGTVVFSEPLALWASLRKLRKHVPIHTDATPDERPLSPAELDVVKRHLPDLEIRHFGFLLRFSRFLLPPGNDYEGAKAWQKGAVDTLAGVDWLVLGNRPLAPLGGMAVLWSQLPGTH